MDSVKKLEVMAASWYKSAPHLPTTGQKWLSENVWWLTLVGVILGLVGAFQVVVATFIVGAVGGAYGMALAGATLFNIALTLVLALVSLVLCAMAIRPLREMQKKGWSLLFIVLLVSVLSAVVGLVLSWNIFSFLTSLIFTAIGGYFLYEIRSYFGKVHVSKRA